MKVSRATVETYAAANGIRMRELAYELLPLIDGQDLATAFLALAQATKVIVEHAVHQTPEHERCHFAEVLIDLILSEDQEDYYRQIGQVT